MGLAFELAGAAAPAEAERIASLRDRLWRGLASLSGTLRNGDAARSVPHILNVSFEGVEGESLLAALRGRLAVSTGSACSSALQEPSYVLRALGRDEASRRCHGRLETPSSDVDAEGEVQRSR
jgi:cysteine desulfurase